MSLDLARFDASTPIPANFAAVVRNEVAAIDELPTLGGYRDRLAVLESYLARKSQDCAEVRRAQRFVEIRIGELIGPAEMGRPTEQSSIAIELSKDERHAFRLMAEHADVVETAVERGDDSRRAVVTAIRRHQREHTPAQPDVDITDADIDGVAVWHGDFRDRLASLPDASVDLIVTDPPYPKEDLPLYSDLGKVASTLLGPRGILFVWTGQIFLPEVIKRLSEHLTYGWTFALHLPGSGSRIMGRHIIQAWKPVLAFTVGTWPSGEWGDDWLVSPGRDKAEYEWQQNAAPAQRLIERYSPPDGLVVDPFLGVGSFGVAAREAGRRFVGVELDAKRFASARDRILP